MSRARQARARQPVLLAAHLKMGVVAGLLVVLVPPAARAELIRLGSWDGSLETTIDLSRQQTRTAGASRTSFGNTYVTEQVALANSGLWLFDPRVLTMSLGGTAGLSHEWVTLGGDQAFREGTLDSYDVFATILGEQATSINLFANRNQSLLARELAGRSEAITENRGATLFTRRLYLPSTWIFRQERQEELSRSSGIESHREDERNIFTYEGARGWTDREFDVRYELVDLNSLVTPSLSYLSNEVNANYGQDFGTELNRHLDSQFRYLGRSGSADLTNITVNETLRLEHSERFWSEYQYLFLDTDSSGEISMTHTGTMRLHHQLFDSLITTLGGDLVFQTLPGGEKNTVRSQLDFAYTKRLPGQGHLNMGLGGRLEYQGNRFNVLNTFTPQETHVVATPIALPFTLNNPAVLTSSLVVTKSALGPLPPGCLTPSGPPVALVEGRDYSLLPVGNALQVVPISCSGVVPGINPGDTIAIDYQFQVSPSLTFTTESLHTDLSLDYQWIRPYVAHSQSAQTLISGNEQGLLDHLESDALGIELRRNGQRVHANLLGEASRSTSAHLAYDQLRSSQYLTVLVRPDVTFTVSADEAWLSFSKPSHDTRTAATGATLTYTPQATLLMELSSSLRQLSDTLLADERRTQTALRARWYFRRLEVTPSLELFEWRRGKTETREYRAYMKVVRRF